MIEGGRNTAIIFFFPDNFTFNYKKREGKENFSRRTSDLCMKLSSTLYWKVLLHQQLYFHGKRETPFSVNENHTSRI